MRKLVPLSNLMIVAVFLGLTTNFSFLALGQQRQNPRVEEMTKARAMDRAIILSVSRLMDQQHLSKHSLDD